MQSLFASDFVALQTIFDANFNENLLFHSGTQIQKSDKNKHKS
jgi:hypothetical protein